MEKIEQLMDSLETQERENTRNDYLKYIRKWPWFVLSSILGLAIGFTALKLTPETYQVQSRLLVYSEDNSLSSELSFEERRYSERPLIGDQIGILQSYSIFREAIDNLDWKTTWYKNELFTKTELYKNEPFNVITSDNAVNLKYVPVNITALNDKEYLIWVDSKTFINGVEQTVNFESKEYFNKPFKNDFFNFSISSKKGIAGENYSFVFNKANRLTALYQKKISITANDKESELVLIQSEGQIPQKDADFINELNKVYIGFGMEKKNLTSESSVNFIDNQADEVKESLRLAEEKINRYRKSNQLMDLGQEASMIYTRLSEVENEKYQAEQLLQYYQNLKRNLNNSETIEQISSPAFQADSNDGLNDMVANLKVLYNRREVLALSVKEKSPNFIQLVREIDLAQQGIEDRLDNLISTVQRDKQNVNNRYQSIQSRLSRLPDTEKNLISMQRDFDVNNELYNFLLKKKAEAGISQASIAPQAKVIDPAMGEYAIRLGPNFMMYIFAGLFAGLLIPFLIITIGGLFNNKIETVKEIESKINIPVIDEIIHHKYKDNLPVVKHPRSGITESFRDLKVKLINRALDSGQKVISINSMISGEGKSFISANFAAILSMSNKKTLLVRTDLRNPKLHTFLGAKEGLGLSTYLSNEVGFDEIINETSLSNFYFVQAGPIPENPTELLENGNFKEFIRIAREKFDFIVLDNAPLLLVPDANWTNRISDVNIFVLRLNYSRKDEISEINKTININKTKNAFLVVNDTSPKGYKYGKRYWKNGYGTYNKKMKIA